MRGPLGDRLRALVLTYADATTLTCRFVPGGKLHGVGIASELYCARCGQARQWHDVAEAAARVHVPTTPATRRERLCATVVGRQN